MTEKLTAREKEVISLLVLTDKEIAEKLQVEVTTAKVHVANARRKLEARTKAETLIKAINKKLTTVEEVMKVINEV